MSLNTLTIAEARAQLDAGEITAVQLTQACLDRIKERNGELNAFITVTEELALAQAAEADKRIAAGNSEPLTGIPFGVKDTFCVAGVRSTGAATILDQYKPPYTATVVQRVLDQGAVLVGKQNCDAFGHGIGTENSMYGVSKNPHDATRVAGGSSGGSAAAVADNMCLFSIAEDTGGSIRQPAAFCGIVGLRPSYGRNSRYGSMPMASSLDTAGPMAKTVADVATVQSVMAGHDEKDATTVPDPVPEATLAHTSLAGVKIGVPKEYFGVDGLDEETQQAIHHQIETAKNAGATIVDISLPHTKYAVATYYIIVPSEDSSNLARLDGVRYGSRKSEESLDSLYKISRAEGFPAEVKRRIMIGTYALSAGYYDAYYRKAQKVRTLICRDFDAAFQDVDVIVTPTSPFPAYVIGEKKDDLLSQYLADIFLSASALAGLPAVSIPAGTTEGGLPIGLQLIGPRLGEQTVLSVGNVIASV